MKILIAEDEQETLQLYKILLENDGHDVMTTKDGAECMQAYKKMADKEARVGDPAFDLVILDLRMPEKSGLDAANEILAICPSQELLMITSYGGELRLKNGLSKMKIMIKPFDVDDFMSFVHELGSRSGK